MNEKIKEHIDWDYFRNVPIEEVAQSLGIEIDRRGKALCPCHDDHDPSMIIGSKTNEKRKNRWWCPVCNEGGTPLDLVLACIYGVKPSDVRKDRSRYSEEIKGAAHYLEDLFPGGITTIDLTPNKKGTSEPIPPNVPYYIIREIGLKHHPLFDKSQRMEFLTKTDRAELLLDKLEEHERAIWDYSTRVLINFPDLDSKATTYILNHAKELMAEISVYTEAVRKYYFAISDYEYPDSFVDELDELVQEDEKDNDSMDVEYA